MDAGNLPSNTPPPSAAVAAAAGSPAEVYTESMILSMTDEQIASLAVAIVVHVILVMLLALVAVAIIKEDPPELTINSTSFSTEPSINKKDYSQSFKQDKPSPPAAASTQLLTATMQSSVAIPTLDVIKDVPIHIGTSGFGMGFGGGGSGNGLGAATFFGTTGGGNRIILVVDTSTSMPGQCGPNGIQAIRDEIKKTVTTLPPSTMFNIICYGNMADGLFEKPVAADSSRKQQVEKFMAGYFGKGPFPRTRTETFGTKGIDSDGVEYIPIPTDKVSGLKGTTGGSRLDLALVAAFDQKATSIFLITDGAPSTAKDGKRLSEKDIVKLVDDEADRVYGKNNHPVVNCISINGIGASILKDISRKFKGKYKDIEPKKL
jgi:hypothetical protein